MSDASARRSPDPVLIRVAAASEAETIASVIRVAFTTVAEEIGFDIPPVHETANDVLSTFREGDAVLVAEIAGAVVGTVRGETLDDGGVMIRRLAVLPEQRGFGIARSLMLALEDAYPAASRFELFTGAEAVGPIALYTSLGYRVIEPRREMGFPLVYLEKCR